MRRMRIELSTEELEELTKRIRSYTVSVRDQRRAKVILLAAEGRTQEQIALEVSLTRGAVGTWCRRFMMYRLAGLADCKGRGRKSSLPPNAVKTVLDEVVSPPPHLGRFSCRTMAVHAGVSPSSVQRLWSANDIKPHLTNTFKQSNEKALEQKYWDVIGLYLSPSDKSLVLCCDEKTQIQALPRTQSGSSLSAGHDTAKTHDFFRNGTLSLFAALNYLESKVTTQITEFHRHLDWLAFLQKIDRKTPKRIDIHLIADNYGAHEHPHVRTWLDEHPKFHMHITPASSSWMDLVERFFRDMSGVLAEGSFNSAKQLSDSIMAHLAEQNHNPFRYAWLAERYLWKSTGEDIPWRVHGSGEQQRTSLNV